MGNAMVRFRSVLVLVAGVLMVDEKVEPSTARMILGGADGLNRKKLQDAPKPRDRLDLLFYQMQETAWRVAN